MNWEAIGAIAELVRAIAVVASLLYLAIQVRQNAEVNRATAFQDIFDGLTTHNNFTFGWVVNGTNPFLVGSPKVSDVNC